MLRIPACLLVLAALSACGGNAPVPVPTAPPVAAADGLSRAAARACREEADRVVLYRDRGQLMREDERDARIGVESSIYARRGETDRLGRIFERDRLAAECASQGSAAAARPARLPPGPARP